MKRWGIALLMACLTSTAIAESERELLPAGSALHAWQPVGGWEEVGNVTLDPQDARKLKHEAGIGIILSQGKAGYLLTESSYQDLEVHVEFMIPKDSNSGIYFCGSHEIQILDSFEKDPPYPGNACAGVYPEWVGGENVRGHSPRVNVSRPPGEWQTFDVVYRAPRFDKNGAKIANARFEKVVHNGVLVLEEVEVLGTTRSGLPEKATGPLRLQGDHGPVAYRNIRIRVIESGP
jgi:hypothetical protein